MNPIIFILLCFAALGLFDKILKNRLGLASSFDKGMVTMGDFMLSVGGFYCIAIAFLNGHASLFENKEMIISSLLAPDLGGYSIVASMSKSNCILIFCGVLLTSTLGCLISFQLPIFLNELNKEDNVTIIMISHDISEVATYASHVLHIGEHVFYGTKEEYLSSKIGKRLVDAGEEEKA